MIDRIFEIPENLSSCEKQLLIATINAIERIPRVAASADKLVKDIGGMEILEALDKVTFNNCMDTEEHPYDADDMLGLLAELNTAVIFGEHENAVVIDDTIKLRDRLFEDWNNSDVMVEGLCPDGSLLRPITFEEFAENPEKYIDEQGGLNPHSLLIAGYTMENVSSGEPVLISADDYETAAKAYLEHGNTLEDYI